MRVRASLSHDLCEETTMSTDRRNFLRVAGAAGAMAATGAAIPGTGTSAQAAPVRPSIHGMAKALTLLTLKRNNELRLGVKTDHGILDVKEAAATLRMPAPATMDELLQQQDGPNLNALVEAALKANAAKKSFLKEEA